MSPLLIWPSWLSCCFYYLLQNKSGDRRRFCHPYFLCETVNYVSVIPPSARAIPVSLQFDNPRLDQSAKKDIRGCH